MSDADLESLLKKIQKKKKSAGKPTPADNIAIVEALTLAKYMYNSESYEEWYTRRFNKENTNKTVLEYWQDKMVVKEFATYSKQLLARRNENKEKLLVTSVTVGSLSHLSTEIGAEIGTK